MALDVGHMDVQDMFEKNQSMKTTTYPLLSTKKTRDLVGSLIVRSFRASKRARLDVVGFPFPQIFV